jgi:type IV secretory pathway VirB10-like protein
MMLPSRTVTVRLAALLLFGGAGLAQAQFVWIAPNGTRQYSDQPPPPGTPASKILKAPGRAAPEPLPAAAPSPAAAGAAAAAASASAAAPALPPPGTLARREAEFRQRAKDREQAEGRARAASAEAEARRAACEGARKNLRLAESGVRIADIGADGKRRYLSEAERSAMGERNARQLSDCP